jgi:hypothetical protein
MFHALWYLPGSARFQCVRQRLAERVFTFPEPGRFNTRRDVGLAIHKSVIAGTRHRCDTPIVPMFSALALLVLPLTRADAVAPIAPEIVARATHCGLGQATVRADRELQANVIVIAGTTEPSDGQLTCLDLATAHHFVELPPDIQPRFDTIRSTRLRQQASANARAWLEQRNLLARVPAYTKGETDPTQIAREVEALCGHVATGALIPAHDAHILSRDWMIKLGKMPTHEANEILGCLFKVAQVAGLEIGFVGNEIAR